MAISKVVYGGTTLIDLTSDTVTAESLLSGTTAHDKSGAAITGTLSPGGGTSTISGTFSPTSSDYAKGKSIQVTVPKFPRCVCVFNTGISTAVDRYSIQFLTIWNPNETMANAQTVWCGTRYKSSTSSGTTFTQGGAYAATAWNSSYKSTDASSYQYACTVTSSIVYFKTYGNYRFRQSDTYRYMIFFD